MANIENNSYKVKAQGRTKEKGNKWVNFALTTAVQGKLTDWLTSHRPANPSPYLFPGSVDGHMSTDAIRDTFKRLCIAAGLHGKEFHPHALRHTYAHLLLETGNSVDIVAKCLNHSNSKVTEQFYLKENATWREFPRID